MNGDDKWTDGSRDDVRGGGHFVIVWGGNFDQIQGDCIFVEWVGNLCDRGVIETSPIKIPRAFSHLLAQHVIDIR